MYSAEISRKNPGCFIFLLDQSASMEDPFGGSSDRRKADELATIINKLIHNLSIRCAKGDSMYDYFHVGVIGYGQDTVVKSAFDGALTGKDLIPISDLANNPLRIEDRTKKADDGAGGLVEQTVKFPLWFEPRHVGGTPMSPKGFPPIVINITDGEATDGDPVPEAKALCSLGSDDGAALVFNIHLSSAAGNAIELPASDEGLPDKFAKQLFEMSSSLTPFMIGRAKELGMPAGDGARGFIFNAQPMQVIQFLDIGTRPANLR
ncbi:MAG: VWA domain-containing protein [Deltaproteobacteria bacterium]|nr:MAG: VWA domain-containing protein [Deltaproteobacteria bacterium]